MTRCYMPLLALCLILTACAVPASKAAPDDHRKGVQAQNSPAMMSERTSTPDLTQKAQDAMLVASAKMTQRIQEAGYQANTETKAVSLTSAVYNAQTLTAQPGAQTATKSAQSTADMLVSAKYTQESDHATQTKDAPADVATAQHLLEYAKSEPVRAWTEPILNIGGGIGLGAFGLAMLLIVAMKWHWYSTAQEEIAPEHPESVTRPVVPLSPTGDGVKPLPVDPTTMHKFLVHAITGAALGKSSMETSGAWKSGKADRARHTAIMEYLIGYEHIDEDANGKQTLAPDAVVFWVSWMEKYSPAPKANITQSADSSLHGSALHGMESSGAGVGDPFNITNDADNFSPDRSGGVLRGYLIPEDKDG